MPTKRKLETIEELKERFTRCTITVVTDHTGMGANTLMELRRNMLERDVEYRVVKNTLTYLAADAADKPQIREIVQGPTALAFGYGDPVEAAKALEEYIRVNRSPMAIKGAVMEGRTLSASQVTALSKLPPRAELLARLLGQAQTPLYGLMGQLQAPMYKMLDVLNRPLASLAVLLQQRMEQLKSQEVAG